MSYIIADPIKILCTTCHQAMHIELQESLVRQDGVVVAAGCKCGRRTGIVNAGALYGAQHGRPLIAHDIEPVDVGIEAQRMVEDGRALVERGERWIAAATWAKGRA
jgi:hypothetical protein